MLSNSRDEVMERLSAEGIETRPFFHPMHTLPMYRSASGGNAFPVADRLAAQGISLTSYAQFSPEDMDYVFERLTRTLSMRN